MDQQAWSLLETTKPYLVGTVRMAAAQTLLFLSHSIHTNAAFTRIVCDSWLLLEFPYPDSGINLLLRAARLKRRWDDMIKERLDNYESNSVEDISKKHKSTKSRSEAQYELSYDLADYMNTNVCYTIKKLLPADLKVLYVGNFADSTHLDIAPNPFDVEFKATTNETEGGVWITDHIVYNCITDTDWSHRNYSEMCSMEWVCPKCDQTLCLPPLEKLQHKEFFCSTKSGKEIPESSGGQVVSNRPNAKKFTCDFCKKTMILTPVEVLKHKKYCNKSLS